MAVVYPTRGDVLEIHRKELDVSGGATGVRDESGIDAALERMQQVLFGEDAYPTLASEAAAFFQTLILRHPFVDGNKRTAVRTTYAFLEINGRRVTANPEETVELAQATAAGELDVDELADWFEEHTAPKEDG
ncbi:MAG: type II toxin-antitoxin system death-on-curing family toxin [Bradymonadaceae bacterium]